MNRIPLLLLLAMISSTSFIRANAQVVASQLIDSVITARAEAFTREPNAAGLSIGLYRLGESYTYHFGTIRKGVQLRPTDSTLYPIASITKTFTGLLLAQAATEGRLKLDDDVRQYLDGNYPNLEYNGQPVRLYHLVSHVSRLPFNISPRIDLPGYTRADFFNDLHKVKIDTIPGVKFQYSNAAAQLAGYVLEKIYNEPFESLLKSKIAIPLGMRHTCLSLMPEDHKLLATGYTASGLADTSNYATMGAAGGLKSTVTDLLKYLRAQLGANSEAIKLTRRESWGFDMSNGSRYICGLNWQIIRKPDGTQRIFQDGNVPGYSCKMIILPEEDMGIVVLSNAFLPDQLSELADGILEAILLSNQYD